MRSPGVLFFAVAAVLLGGGAAFADPAPRVCYSAAETRQRILDDKLAEPFALMRAQASEHRADAIGVKLCRNAAALVYEIDLLRRDGRLIHSRLDAATGKPLASDGGR
jgi:hypothetical protein